MTEAEQLAEKRWKMTKRLPQNRLPHYFTKSGALIVCWQLSWRDRWRILLNGQVWLRTDEKATTFSAVQFQQDYEFPIM